MSRELSYSHRVVTTQLTPEPGVITPESARGAGTFYFSNAEPYDWTTPQNNALWQDGAKTLFDPCPAGWRVPKGGKEASPLIMFTQTNGPWIEQNGDVGHLFNNTVVHTGSAWYPACGWRHYATAAFGSVLAHADIWFSTTSNPQSYNLFSVDGGVYPSALASRAYGFPVRCIRE